MCRNPTAPSAGFICIIRSTLSQQFPSSLLSVPELQHNDNPALPKQLSKVDSVFLMEMPPPRPWQMQTSAEKRWSRCSSQTRPGVSDGDLQSRTGSRASLRFDGAGFSVALSSYPPPPPPAVGMHSCSPWRCLIFCLMCLIPITLLN